MRSFFVFLVLGTAASYIALLAIESRSRKSVQFDKWNICLTAGTVLPANQEH